MSLDLDLENPLDLAVTVKQNLDVESILRLKHQLVIDIYRLTIVNNLMYILKASRAYMGYITTKRW